MAEIGLRTITVSLRGSGGSEPTGDAFFRAVGLTADGTVRLKPNRSAWQTARADLFSLNAADFADQDNPAEAFADALAAEFGRAAEVLAHCRSDGVREWRAYGWTVDLFIGGWLANEQFDLNLPASLVAECGRLGLDICLCTND